MIDKDRQEGAETLGWRTQPRHDAAFPELGAFSLPWRTETDTVKMPTPLPYEAGCVPAPSQSIDAVKGGRHREIRESTPGSFVLSVRRRRIRGDRRGACLRKRYGPT